MPTDKIAVFHDPRVHLKSAHLNGRTYGYLHSIPERSPIIGTVILIHGFPDISMGWRYQIPLFLSMGFQVIAPDCMGYGRTDAPTPLADYSYRRISDDLAELARQLGITSFVLGGHDWGGAIVYRVAAYYPKLVSHFFSICTPYFVPSPKYEPLHLLVNTKLPNFRYQQHFASGELEEALQSKEEIKSFLNGLYGARTPDGKVAFNAEGGVDVAMLPKLGKTPLLSDDEIEYYATEFHRHGLRGPLNWYRNREVNWQDEWIGIFDSGKNVGPDAVPKIRQECLFVMATKDAALRPFMAEKMGERIPRLTRREVDGGHWILWQRSEEVNRVIGEWVEEKVLPDLGKGRSKL